MTKKILITGATGFIGQNVFSLLKKNQYKVIGLSIDGGHIDKEKIFKLDLGDSQKLSSFFKTNHFDTIIHLAARVPQKDNESDQRLALIENTASTLNILEEFKQSKAKKFIYASGISVEEVEKNNLSSLYVASKYFGEILGEQYRQKTKKEVIILRISAPYGPGQNPHNVIPIFIKNALKNKNIRIFGTGQRSQDFIYIDDLARAFLAAVKYDRSGIYNIGSGQSTSTVSLAKIILKNVPKSRSKIIFSRVDPQENYRLRMDIKKTKKDLKFSPKIMIEEGIKKYIEYFKSS